MSISVAHISRRGPGNLFIAGSTLDLGKKAKRCGLQEDTEIFDVTFLNVLPLASYGAELIGWRN